jgi:hypothetical protein
MQSAKELREQAERCVRIAATVNADDAAALMQMARESLRSAYELDGGAASNGGDVSALIEIALAGNKPRPSDAKRQSAETAGR